jgi:outer membrane protein OmpA-like peptidoglycan-associated protein
MVKLPLKSKCSHCPQIWISILAFLIISGCVATLKGERVETYGYEYFETVQTSIDTLSTLKAKIAEETSDELKTSIKAVRPEGTPVWIKITQIDHQETQVGVLVGAVGSRDPKMSEQIQDMIGERLNNRKAELDSKLYENVDLPEDTEISNAHADEQHMDEQHADEQHMDEQHADEQHADEMPLDDNSVAYEYNEYNEVFTIFFKYNSNEIPENNIEKLNRIAQHIINMPNAKVIVHGYTDSTGSAEYNKYISESRAASIRAYLIAKGVDPENIRVIAHGAKDFISDNDTAEGRDKNRRVEIVVSP